MDDQKRQELLGKIKDRRAFHQKWGDQNFVWSRIFTGVAVFASFASAIASATGVVSHITIAVVAALPGVAIGLETGFSFARLARWHWMMVARCSELENALLFEDAQVEDVSKRFSAIRIKMDEQFPKVLVEGLSSSQGLK